MKKIIFLICVNSFLLISNQSYCQLFKYMGRPRPLPSKGAADYDKVIQFSNARSKSEKAGITIPEQYKNGWYVKPTVQIPAIKIVKSQTTDTKFDGIFVPSVGGGLTISHTTVDHDKNGELKNTSDFSWSPLTVLITGNTTTGSTVGLAWATSIGFFNNAIQFGTGYDFGTVTPGRGRWFGLLSIGINLNQN